MLSGKKRLEAKRFATKVRGTRAVTSTGRTRGSGKTSGTGVGQFARQLQKFGSLHIDDPKAIQLKFQSRKEFKESKRRSKRNFKC